MRQALDGFLLIRLLSTIGDPPEKYVVEYRIRGLAPGTGAEPWVREEHRVEITLAPDFPRESPRCRMLTPVFHPNISETVIDPCDEWKGSDSLIELVIRIGRVIAFQVYNTRSSMDREAAMWAELNAHRLPIDRRELHSPNCE